ncbi:MAG TPA: enoyl-CoA hydratase-related protein [Candidatus Binatia bacterium]|nr:enoyl-CoA hydratase-related protein [Candidatus Binatia bacterium]
MKQSTVLEDFQDDIVVLTLNRPKQRNAFNDQQYNDLSAALARAADSDRVHVVVITGAGGAFSAGQDINEMGSGSAFTPFVNQLMRFDKPLIAAVNGVAVGIGVTMLPHCDLVYVAAGARLRAPFAALGLVCEAGSSLLLPMVMGAQRAADVLLSARWMTSSDAVALGLAACAVPDHELMATAMAKAREIAAQPLVVLRQIKWLLRAGYVDALRAAREREDALQATRLGSPENRAAIDAFQRKRPRETP